MFRIQADQRTETVCTYRHQLMATHSLRHYQRLAQKQVTHNDNNMNFDLKIMT